MFSPPIPAGDFEFSTAQRIVFGCGALKRSLGSFRDSGKRALLVTGSDPDRALSRLSGIDCAIAKVRNEPTVDVVRSLCETARAEACDYVIGFGGGSVIDAAKAAAAILANGGDPLDYLEVVGRGLPLTKPSLPFFAVPTTAGAGAEVTKNAVLGSPEHRVKASLRSPFLLARMAVVDPELTYDLPPALTAATGLDALTQLIEPFVSIRANALTDGYCREGIRRAAASLRQAYEGDRKARIEMSLAALLGGLALANAGLGAVHGFAAPIGVMFPAPHGAVCAALLPQVMRANIAAMPDSSRYDEAARLLTGRVDAKAEDGVRWVEELSRDLAIPRLSAYGITASDVSTLVDNATQASSMKANPVVLPRETLTEVLLAAI